MKHCQVNKLLLLIIFSALGKICIAQKKIKLKEVSKHIGDSVKLEGMKIKLSVFSLVLALRHEANDGFEYSNKIYQFWLSTRRQHSAGKAANGIH